MKRFLSLSTFLLLNIMAFASTLVNGIYYEFSGTEATVVSGANKYTGDVVIPESVTYGGNTYKVTGIGETSFSSCINLKSIIIPSSVTSIGYWAFSACRGLQSVTIPDGVKSIENGTFSECDKLTSITIPNNVTTIGYRAFYSCNNLTELVIGNNVTYIGEEAFSDCAFTSLTIPNSVKNVGNFAFSSCYKLKDVSILDGNEEIDFGKTSYSAFQYCSIQTLYLGRNIKYYNSNSPFKGQSSLTSLTISDEVTSISQYAFAGCTGLTSVTIPESVTTIERNAFYDCKNLTSIIIPNSVTSIGEQAFAECEGLTSITIPNSVTNIDKSVFSWCTSLTSITIPSSVTSIGEYAFQQCSSLKSINIPNSVTSIDSYAFSYCNELVSIVIPKSVTTIEKGVFLGCSNFNEITLEGRTPPVISSSIFSTPTPTDLKIYVPFGCKEAYLQAGWTNYESFIIEKEDTRDVQTISLNEIPTIEYGGEGYTLPATTEEGLLLTWSIENVSTASIENNTIYAIGVGTTKVTASQQGNDNYQPFYKEYALVIDKGTQTITWEQDFSNVKQFDQIELSAISSSGLDVTYIVEGSTNCSITKIGNKTYLECNGIGDVILSAYQEGNEYYWNTLKTYKSFTIKSPTAINDIKFENSENIQKTFTNDGKQFPQPQKGLNILKMSDGTTRKVVK